MTYFSIIRRSFVAISALALSLILWLSGSFWYDAYLQRVDASELLQSIKLDDALFRMTRTLSKERDLVHIMLNDTSSKNAVKKAALVELQGNSHKLNRQILRNITVAMDTPSLVSRLIFEPAIVEGQLRSMSTQWNQLNFVRESLVAQLSMSSVDRDLNLQEQVFDQYTASIDATRLLKDKFRISPRRTELSIDQLQSLRTANWYFGQKFAKQATLVSGMIAQGKLATTSRLQMIEALHADSLNRWEELHYYVQTQGSNSTVVDVIRRIQERYFDEYLELSNEILSDYQTQGSTPVWLDQWLFTVNTVNSQLDTLDEKISQEARSLGQQVEAHAVRRLIIDTVVVLTCLFIGAAVVTTLKRIQHLATHDALTGLPNRIRFESLLEYELNNRKAYRIGVMVIDLDGFKQVNDRLGHIYGDRLLNQVASRLTQCTSDRVVLARIGGDEFALIEKIYAADKKIETSAERFLSDLSREFEIEDIRVQIGASIGLSYCSNEIYSATELIKNADIAMYHAKTQGKNCVRVYDQKIADKYQHRIELELELKQAIKEQQFQLYYQPQVNVQTQNVDGVEALIRWNHPEKGLIPPNDFIPIAEETGLLPVIGDWVIDEACRQISIWNGSGMAGIRIAVNISTAHFSRLGFVEYVEDTYKKHDIDPTSLELEITESVLVADVQSVIDTFNQLRALQIEIAIDDFGTGYSSLSYLQDLPVDTIKIDKSFIDKLDENGENSIAKTIVTLAKTYGLKTVAEGVETEIQHTQVRELACEYIQGYFYSKPLIASEVSQKISEINALYSTERAA